MVWCCRVQIKVVVVVIINVEKIYRRLGIAELFAQSFVQFNTLTDLEFILSKHINYGQLMLGRTERQLLSVNSSYHRKPYNVKQREKPRRNSLRRNNIPFYCVCALARIGGVFITLNLLLFVI